MNKFEREKKTEKRKGDDRYKMNVSIVLFRVILVVREVMNASFQYNPSFS